MNEPRTEEGSPSIYGRGAAGGNVGNGSLAGVSPLNRVCVVIGAGLVAAHLVSTPVGALAELGLASDVLAVRVAGQVISWVMGALAVGWLGPFVLSAPLNPGAGVMSVLRWVVVALMLANQTLHALAVEVGQQGEVKTAQVLVLLAGACWDAAMLGVLWRVRRVECVYLDGTLEPLAGVALIMWGLFALQSASLTMGWMPSGFGGSDSVGWLLGLVLPLPAAALLCAHAVRQWRASADVRTAA